MLKEVKSGLTLVLDHSTFLGVGHRQKKLFRNVGLTGILQTNLRGAEKYKLKIIKT